MACNEVCYHRNDSDYPTTQINFKVSLTTSDNNGNKAGIGVFLGKIRARNHSSFSPSQVIETYFL